MNKAKIFINIYFYFIIFGYSFLRTYLKYQYNNYIMSAIFVIFGILVIILKTIPTNWYFEDKKFKTFGIVSLSLGTLLFILTILKVLPVTHI